MPTTPTSPRRRRAAAQKPQLTDSDPSNPAPNMLHSTTVVAGMRRLLSTEEASVYLDCHLRTVFRLIEEGRLKAYRLGRSLKFRQEDLDAVLEPVHAGSAGEATLDSLIGQQTKSGAL